MRDARRSATRLVLLLLALLLVLLFAALGRWQWARAGEKAALLARVEAVLAERRALPAERIDPREPAQLAWTTLTGRFPALPALLLDNQLRDGRSGLVLYRVFEADGAPAPLLLELGWLPLRADRVLPRLERPAGPVTLSGLLLPPPSSGLKLGSGIEPRDEGLLLTRLDPADLSAALGLRTPLAARVFRPDPSAALGPARDFNLLPNTLPPERHRGYAVQWWSLAAAVAVLALVMAWRTRRSRA